MKKIEDLRISLFSDGADLAGILEMYANPWIRGFTTNPTLMRKAGVRNYEAFARSLVRAVPDRPISLEVFADDEAEMEMLLDLGVDGIMTDRPRILKRVMQARGLW